MPPLLPEYTLITNAVLILIAIVISISILSNAFQFNISSGDDALQATLKRRILRLLALLFILALAATIFNLLFGF